MRYRVLLSTLLLASAGSPSSSVAEPVPVNPNKPRDANSWYATSLICPRGANGVLEFSMRTPAGALSKIWVDYSNAEPAKVKMLVWPSDGAAVETAVDAALTSDLDDKRSAAVRSIRRYTDRVFDEVCLGSSANKRQYDTILTENRTFLKE